MLRSRWCAEAAQALLPHYNKKTKQNNNNEKKKQQKTKTRSWWLSKCKWYFEYCLKF